MVKNPPNLEASLREGFTRGCATPPKAERQRFLRNALCNRRVKNLSILLVGHVTESYGPMQAFPRYLSKKVTEFAIISHPFPYSGIPYSKCLLFKNAKLIQEYSGLGYKTFHLIHYFSDVFLTLYFCLRLKKRWHLYIGSDCLNVFSGIILRNLGVIKKVIFYEYDYTPQRFRNPTLNRLFHWFNAFAACHADIIWDNPPNLAKIRKKQGADPAEVIRVPHGVDQDKIKIPPAKNVNRFRLVYVGHLTKSKGLQLLVKALKKVVKIVPQLKVVIIGSGPYEATFKKLVEKNKLKKYFNFFGFTDHDWTLSFLPSCGVALAPYVEEARGTFKYADPLKVRDYLGCGLPIIITKVPQIAKEIEEKKLGIAIGYNQKELTKAIIKLLTDDQFYQKCRKNVLNYSKNISWDHTYNQAFSKTLKRIRM